MSHILSLIANPDRPILDASTVQQIAELVGSDTVTVLNEGVAADIALDKAGDSVLQTVRDALAGKAIDANIVPAGNERRKRILIADMDSTMIQQECIDELAAEAGIKDKVAEITARAMNGEIEFEGALRERVGLLKGLPSGVIDQVIASRITLMPGGPELLATMRANGAHCALVSGGFTDFTQKIADRLGFHENRANTLLHENGTLSGKVAEPILGKQAKVDALDDICQRLGIGADQAIAVGDGANDLGMLKKAGFGVALHAKPAVAAEAGLRVDHGDLTALLYLQGYSAAEFKK